MKFEEYVKSLNEELSFTLNVVEYKYEVIGNIHRYTFNIEDNDIVVSFIENLEGQYEREYSINDTMIYTGIDSKIGLKIIQAVTYITKEFLEKFNPDKVAIYHIDDGVLSTKKKEWS